MRSREAAKFSTSLIELTCTMLLPLWAALTEAAVAAPSVQSTTGSSGSFNATVSGLSDSPESVARFVVEQAGGVGVTTPLISPDGKWVYYVRRPAPSLEHDTPSGLSTWEHWLIPGEQTAGLTPIRLPAGVRDFQWLPNSTECSLVLSSETEGMGAVKLFNLGTREFSDLPFPSAEGMRYAPPIKGVFPLAPLTMDGFYRWAPDGRTVAFLAPVELPPIKRKADPRRGITLEEWEPERSGIPQLALFLLDLKTRALRRVSPENLDLQGEFDWAPDGKGVAVTVKNPNPAAYTGVPAGFDSYRRDIYYLDLVKGRAIPLATSVESDEYGPVFSPDSKRVAFLSDSEPVLDFPHVAVVAMASKELVHFANHEDVTVKSIAWWSADSREIFYTVRELTTQLRRASVVDRKVTAVPSLSSAFSGGWENSSVSADRRTLVYASQSPIRPPEIRWQRINSDGTTSGPSMLLSESTQAFEDASGVRIDRLEWRSLDGQFMIRGLLLTRKGAWTTDGKLVSALPTIVSLQGGPNPIGVRFGRETPYGIDLTLAMRGYAVLIPNTRGRHGAYGRDFGLAIHDDRSAKAKPFEDFMAGVDLLVKRGIADPDRLGIFGHSYGGSSVAHAVTQTHRFKAAVNHEGNAINLMDTSYISWGQQQHINDLLFGIDDPFDPVMRQKMIADSPLLNADKVKTPFLYITGKDERVKKGAGFVRILRRFGVPSTQLIYDMGHSPDSPAEHADTIVRVHEWFDYWVRGIEYPNAERARQYARRPPH